MIEVNHVSKRYGKHVALDDLNLTVENGKIYGLLGETVQENPPP
jgi:ABC-2 type transport system ATP-binding protein